MSYPKNTPPRILKTFKRLESERGKKLQLNRIDNRYYLYEPVSEWDREKKKASKKTRYMGSIQSNGLFIPRRVRSSLRETKREVFEYGNGALAHHLLRDAEEMLKDQPNHRTLMACAIIQAIHPTPIRLLASRWEKLHLSTSFPVSLSPRHVSNVLHDTGKNVYWWYDFFSKLMNGSDLLLYDLTAVFTHSEKLVFAERGYNPDHLYYDQISVVMAFSSSDSIPVGMDVFYGSVRDIATIRDFLERLPETKGIGFIFDRGFSSYKLLDDFRKENIHYLVPLKKNSVLFDLRWIRWKDPFLYRERPIRWGVKKTKYGRLYIFEDPVLRGEQDAALLRKLEKGEIDRNTYEEKKRLAGIIGIISDLDKNGIDIYDLYKGRVDVEKAFDAMKNVLEADKTNLQTPESVRGYFFVTFLALRVYFGILKRLREKKLTTKISVEEVLFELSKVVRIVEPNGREYAAKIPKRAMRILELFPEISPMV